MDSIGYRTYAQVLKEWTVVESYDYDAYGVMLSDITSGSGADAAAGSATSLLYAGEQYDASSEMYYLRARYYNPANGIFNRMDPYAGNMQDPQSLHKYAYVHNNPVNGIDPSGQFADFSIGGILIGISLANSLRDIYDANVSSVGSALQKAISGIQAGKTAEAIIAEYVAETLIGAAAGYVLFKLMGRAFDLDFGVSSPATPSGKFVPCQLKTGTKVYRVIPKKYATLPPNEQMAMINRRSWTTIDPRKVRNYADAAGLPSTNDMGYIVQGRIVNSSGIKSGRAVNNRTFEPDSDIVNSGGLFELQIDDVKSSVRVEKIVPWR